MTLHTLPVKPKSLPITLHLDFGGDIPDLWTSYVYWNTSFAGGGEGSAAEE